MTQVGKILVLVIMAFSLIFLAISTMVFVTSKNWKTETAKKADEVNKVKKSLADAQAEVGLAKKNLEEAKANAKQATKALESRIQTLEDENKRDLAQITTVREQLAVQLQSAKTALDEAEARRKETMLLREQKSAVEKQANEYQLRQADLNDKIRELERILETATKNNGDLRERVAKYTTLLQRNGLSADISQIKGMENPPPVTGQVKKVDPTNKRLEITHRLRRRPGRRPRAVPLPHQAPPRVPRPRADHRRGPRSGRGPGAGQYRPGQEDKGGRHCLVYHRPAVLVPGRPLEVGPPPPSDGPSGSPRPPRATSSSPSWGSPWPPS